MGYPAIPSVARRIPIPGTTNVRDIGGYATESGRVVAMGMIYRAEAIVQPGASSSYSFYDRAAVADYRRLNLSSVIDLRATAETVTAPSAWTTATGASLFEIPVAEGGEGADTDYVRLLLGGTLSKFDADDMGSFYIDLVEKHASAFGAAIGVLADPTNLPALVHCAAGKDRTGVLVALVLSLVGVSDEVVIGDYALTGVLRPNRVAAFEGVFREAGRDPQIARVLFETPHEAMALMLHHIASEYGGARNYLIERAGIGRREVESVVSRLTTDAERADDH